MFMRVAIPFFYILRHSHDMLPHIFCNAQNGNAFHLPQHMYHRFLRTGCKICLQKQCVFIRPCHKCRCRSAHIRTIAIKLNTFRIHLSIVLVQAWSCTMLAISRAVIAGINAVFKFFVTHFLIFFLGCPLWTSIENGNLFSCLNLLYCQISKIMEKD